MTEFLADNSYGAARVRVARVHRHTERHDFQEMDVVIRFEGDFESAFTSGSNKKILPADTIKNTVYAMAREVDEEQIEEFALRMIEHFLAENPQLTVVGVDMAEILWSRVPAGGRPHSHAFHRNGSERRVAMLRGTRDEVVVRSGIENLVLLKTTGSAFEGFLVDPYTTLAESRDQLFSTALNATWLYSRPEIAYRACWQGVRQIIFDMFADHQSQSVQHTLYAMGEAILRSYDDVAEVHIQLPTRHYQQMDLRAFGFDTNDRVYLPSAEPHGIIEARVRKQ
ncbi:MAG TPA: urate oxidase [Candidatus Acidoferrales bacterium]